MEDPTVCPHGCGRLRTVSRYPVLVECPKGHGFGWDPRQSATLVELIDWNVQE
jgi:hypothetical protein